MLKVNRYCGVAGGVKQNEAAPGNAVIDVDHMRLQARATGKAHEVRERVSLPVDGRAGAFRQRRDVCRILGTQVNDRSTAISSTRARTSPNCTDRSTSFTWLITDTLLPAREQIGP